MVFVESEKEKNLGIEGRRIGENARGLCCRRCMMGVVVVAVVMVRRGNRRLGTCGLVSPRVQRIWSQPMLLLLLLFLSLIHSSRSVYFILS